MDIWQLDKLTLFLIFFVPGFLSLKVYDLLIPGERRDFAKALPEAIAYSALNYAFFSWLIVLLTLDAGNSAHLVWHLLALLLIVFVAPVLWPPTILALRSWHPIAAHVSDPFACAWDFVFAKRECAWVIVHLNDGRRIGGKFDANSFAASSPGPRDIYIEEVWALDAKGAFDAPIAGSRGIIVMAADMQAIEFFT